MLLENSKKIVDKIFSFPVLQDLDKVALLARYDVTNDICSINSEIISAQGQTVQEGSVINNIPSGGIVINKPGTYTFSDNLTWNPDNAACSAITIKSDNVVLDLNTCSLTAVVLDNTESIVGINVQKAKHVTIRNGKLINMCLYGICTESVSNLLIENLQIDGLSYINLETGNYKSGWNSYR